MAHSKNDSISNPTRIAGVHGTALRLFFIGVVTSFSLLAFASVDRILAAQQETLAQALADRAAADGFELSGIEKIDDGQTVSAPAQDHSVSSLRKLLIGYNYILELEPKLGAGNASRKPVRLRILGHIAENAGDVAVNAPDAGFADRGNAAFDSPAADPASTAGVSPHPVVNMLTTLAASAMPRDPAPDGAAAQAPASAAPVSDPAHNAADMAALTRSASANVAALVTSLKAACPAGGNC